MILLLLLMLPDPEVYKVNHPIYVVEIDGIRTAAPYDGGFLVLMRRSPFVQVYDQSGALIQEWGDRGQGPGELTHPMDVAVEGETVWVLNKLPGKIEQFDLSGKPQGRHTLRLAGYPIRFAVSNDRILIHNGGFFQPNNNHLISLQDGDEKVIRELSMGATTELRTRPGGTPLTFPLPYEARDHWGLTSKGRLVFQAGDSKELVLETREAGKKIRWSLPEHAHKVTTTALALWVNRFLPPGPGPYANMAGGWRRKAMDLPVPYDFPPVLQMETADLIWVHRAFRVSDQLWLGYRDGQPAAIWEPPISERVLRIRGNTVFLLLETEDGLQLTVAALERP